MGNMASSTSRVQSSIAHTETTTTTANDLQHDEALGGKYSCQETKNAQQSTGSSKMEPKAVLAKWLDNKEKGWRDIAKKQRPLQLLDLPMDVLKDIVTEVCKILAALQSSLSNLGIEPKLTYRSRILMILHLWL